MAQQFRPTSPHLSVWRFTLTMTMSIVHRITGVGLYLGTILFVLWLGAAALGQEELAAVQGFFGHPLITFGLFLYTWTLFHHMAGGIRHLIWDTGAGFDPVGREAMAVGSLIFSIVATVLVWTLFVWL